MISTSGPSGARRALVIYNDPPYGTKRSRNGLRLAHAPSRRDGVDVKMFLPGDAVGCAVAGQKVPDGYRHLGRMIEGAARHGAEAGCCRTCMDAGLTTASGPIQVAVRKVAPRSLVQN